MADSFDLRCEVERLRVALTEAERKNAALMVELNRHADNERAYWGERDAALARAEAAERRRDELVERERVLIRENMKEMGEAVENYESMAAERNIARQDEEAWKAAATAAESALREAVEWCAAGRCVEGIQVGGGLEAALAHARGLLGGSVAPTAAPGGEP